jgi:hypothetical protein
MLKSVAFFPPWRSVMKNKFSITLTACVGLAQGIMIPV